MIDELQKAVIQLENLRWHVAVRTNYERLVPGNAMYEFVQEQMASINTPYAVCDSLNHNDIDGCANPGCWKHIT